MQLYKFRRFSTVNQTLHDKRKVNIKQTCLFKDPAYFNGLHSGSRLFCVRMEDFASVCVCVSLARFSFLFIRIIQMLFPDIRICSICEFRFKHFLFCNSQRSFLISHSVEPFLFVVFIPRLKSCVTYSNLICKWLIKEMFTSIYD